MKTGLTTVVVFIFAVDGQNFMVISLRIVSIYNYLHVTSTLINVDTQPFYF